MVIYTISFVDQDVSLRNLEDLQYPDIHDDMKVYITWIDYEGHVYNYPCPFADDGFRCPLFPESWGDASFGELVIGANFTAIALALQNDRRPKKNIIRDQEQEFLWIQLGHGSDNTPGNAFPLFPNVHLRATLAVTYRKTLKTNKMAALGFQKVSCDAQKIFQHR